MLPVHPERPECPECLNSRVPPERTGLPALNSRARKEPMALLERMGLPAQTVFFHLVLWEPPALMAHSVLLGPRLEPLVGLHYLALVEHSEPTWQWERLVLVQ